MRIYLVIFDVLIHHEIAMAFSPLQAIYIASSALNRHKWRIMKITPIMPEITILNEIGTRAQQHRVSMNLSQAELAATAGVSQRTVERFEAGNSVHLEKLVRILRALQLSANLDQLIPDASISPIQLAESATAQRKRASRRRKPQPMEKDWTWGDKR